MLSRYNRCVSLACLLNTIVATEVIPKNINMPLAEIVTEGQFGVFARYRLDAVEDDTKPKTAVASTIRTALSYETKSWQGLQGLVELYSVNVLGSDRYNWVGNSQGTNSYYSQFPIINDPEHAGFSQLYGQWQNDDHSTHVRVGRQLVELNDQQWLTASRYRQNQNIVDSGWLHHEPLSQLRIDVGYIWAQRDVMARYHSLNGFVVNLMYVLAERTSFTAYGLWTDYDAVSAAQNDLQTIGLRIESVRSKKDAWQCFYIADIASQQPQFDNPSAATKPSWYALGEIGLTHGDFFVRGSYTYRDGTSAEHDVIKAPLGYPYPYRGETEQFVTTPANGVQIYCLRTGAAVPGITGLRAALYLCDFYAVETTAHYGTEFFLQIDYIPPWEKRWSWSLRGAHFHDADADTVANPTYGNQETRLIAMTTFAF